MGSEHSKFTALCAHAKIEDHTFIKDSPEIVPYLKHQGSCCLYCSYTRIFQLLEHCFPICIISILPPFSLYSVYLWTITLISAKSTNTAIQIIWSVSRPGGVTYVVLWQRNTSIGCPEENKGRATTNSTSYLIDGLEEDSTYTIVVIAYRTNSNASSIPVSVTTNPSGTFVIKVHLKMLGLFTISTYSSICCTKQCSSH